MAGNKSDYLEKAQLNWLKGTAYPAVLAGTWVALFTTAPTDTGGGTEVTGGSYVRQEVLSSGWSVISGGGASPDQISNSAVITYPTPTANWGTVLAVGLFDSLPQSTPAAPTATGNTGSGSSFTSGQTVNVAVSYVTPGGETQVSSNTLVTIGANGDNVVVTLPTFPTGVTGMNVYVSTASGGSTLNRVGTGVTSTTSAGTVTVTAFSATGVVVPASNTSGGNLLYWNTITSQVVDTGVVASFAAAALVITED